MGFAMHAIRNILWNFSKVQSIIHNSMTKEIQFEWFEHLDKFRNVIEFLNESFQED